MKEVKPMEFTFAIEQKYDRRVVNETSLSVFVESVHNLVLSSFKLSFENTEPYTTAGLIDWVFFFIFIWKFLI